MPVVGLFLFPKRLVALILLFNLSGTRPRQGFDQPIKIVNSGITWSVYLIIKLIDLSMIWDILDLLSGIIKPNTRLLKKDERIVLQSIFQTDITRYFVRIDSHSLLAYIGKRNTGKSRLGVCVFHTINFTERINTSKKDQKWLLHEMIHVKQYQAIGASYILEALIAQRAEGYSYEIDTQKTLYDYNLEQQAELLSDLVFDDVQVPEKWKESLFRDAQAGRF